MAHSNGFGPKTNRTAVKCTLKCVVWHVNDFDALWRCLFISNAE